MALQELHVNNSPSPPTQSFGNVSVGQYSEITIVLKNSTSPSIGITGNVPSLSAPFSVQSGGGAFTLAANGNTKNVVVRYTPTDPAQFDTTTLNITHDAPNPASPLPVVFDGTGIYLFDQTRKTAGGDVRVLVYGTASYTTAFTNCDLKKVDPIQVGFIDQDETLFFPSNATVMFRDADRTAFDRLSSNKDRIEIHLNGTLEYVGVVDIDQTEFDEKNKTTNVFIFDEVNLLKSILLKDSGNNVVMPFSGYGATQFRREYDLVKDIFKLINPTVGENIYHDWSYKDINGTTRNWFSEVFYATDSLFYGTVKPFANVVELLRYIANRTGSIMGMLTRNTFFMRKRFADPQTAVSLTGKVKTNNRISSLGLKIGARVYKRSSDGASATVTADEGTITTTPAGDLKEAGKVFVADLWVNNSTQNRPFWYDNSGASLHEIDTVRDTSIDSTYRSVEAHMAKYYYAYRTPTRERWELQLYGVGFSILELYSYDSKTLRPVEVIRDFEKNETKMTVVNIT